jgi:Fe-S cluster biosynthesis and repair protein YggX
VTVGAPAWACSRCGKSEPRLAELPFPGDQGTEIAARCCAGCWAEWLRAEVMVINELKLNFMDPAAQVALTSQMRTFLLLDEAPPASG